MEIKKIAGWAVVIFLAYYLLTTPTGAADAMQNLFGLLHTAWHNLSNFFGSIQ